MSEGLEPSTPNTLPALIVWKLDALSLDSEESELNAIRELLDLVPEERVASDEEVQEMKKLENKFHEYQKMFKKKTENMNEKAKFTTRFCLLFPLLLFLSIIIGLILNLDIIVIFILLWNSWPPKLIVVIILFYLYGFKLEFKFLNPFETAEPVQPEVFEDEDDDWQDSMTSTELQSRQKALMNGWKQLKTQRKEASVSDFLFAFALVTNFFYCLLHLSCVDDIRQKKVNFFKGPFLPEPSATFLTVEHIFSYSMLYLFVIQLVAEMIQGSKTSEKKRVDEKPIN